MAAPGALYREQFLDDSGHLLSAGTVEFYLAGTSTPTPFYSDIDLLTSLGTSVTLPANARLAGYFDAALAYKVVVKDAFGATVFTQDNIRFAQPGSGSTDLDRFLIERI